MTFLSIQACRGIAAMMVVAFHIGASFAADIYFGEPLLTRLFRFGSSGVEFFFVLSGFIIFFVHHKDIERPAALTVFLRKRAERIYPSYWLIFGAIAAVALLFPAFREALPDDPWILLKSLLLVPQDPAIVGGTGAPVIIVAWSLHYELVFYLAFALFIVSRPLGIALVAAAAIWWIATSAFGLRPGFPLAFLKPHFFAIFAFGIATAWLSLRGGIRRPWPWLVAGGLLYLACACFEVGQMFLFDLPRSPGRAELVSVGYGMASALLVAGLVAREQRRPIPVPRWLVRMGDASYVIYLLHFPVISACAKVVTRFDGGLPWVIASFVIVFIICCVVGYAFHTLIERPLLSLLRRLRLRPPPAPAATV